MMQRKTQPFTHDPLIIPRVKQYLEENVHQTYVDVGVMARELQQRYREYYRRKTGVFRTMVEQAYRTVLHSYGLDSNPSSENEEEALSEVEIMGATNNRTQMNDTLTSMYMNNRNVHVAGTAADPTSAVDQEAIDISSDEEEQVPDDGRSAAEKSNFVQTFVTANKHVTVTKVTRTNNTREDESSNGSADSNATGTKPGEKFLPESKRRRLEEVPSPEQTISQKLHSNWKTKLHKAADQIARLNNKPTSKPVNKTVGLKKYRKEIVPRVANTTFKEIGGMDRILKNLCELLLHVKHPEIYRHIGMPPPRGFLLHGPPGSGKTLLARSIAGQLQVELIEIPATELIAGVSGESEERIRNVFEQAAAHAPCVLFIDEIDAISSNRINAQKDMERRIVAQLLSSLDVLGKMDGGEGVIVIGATNRADALDPALRRVGRFDQEISLGIPDRAARMQILQIICRKLKLADTIDYGELAKLTPGYVGADLLALATRAANTAIKRLFAQQKKNMLSKEAFNDSSDDVVAIDDEMDEVVNLDDEKDESKAEIDQAVESEPVSAAPKTTSAVQVSDSSQKDQNERAVPATTELLATQEAKEKEIRTENATESMELDAPSPTEAVEKDCSVAVEKVCPVADEKECPVAEEKENQVAVDSTVADDQNEIKSVNGPTEEEPAKDSEAQDNETPKIDSSKMGAEAAKRIEAAKQAESARQAQATKVVALPKEETTLEQMMDMLLNQQNALPMAQLESLCIEREDFMESLRTVQPSAKREGFITVPDVNWNDIGSLGDIREELKLAILAPVKYPHRLRMLGLNAPSGVLLCGPPGCGKTLLAKAVANEAGINFISVKGPELLNMYVGESERAVRQCFQRARNSAPCVIFFDEFDSLCPKRSDTVEGSAGTRVVNQLLTEMDGIEDRKGVFLMAATNRPDIVDPAVLRPGRLDKILYVGLPALDDRADILRALTKNRTQPPLAADVEFDKVAELTEGYTGADLAGLVRQASLQTLKESILSCDEEEKLGVERKDETVLTVSLTHFLEAIRNIKPSVGAEDKRHYEKLRLKYGTSTMC